MTPQRRNSVVKRSRISSINLKRCTVTCFTDDGLENLTLHIRRQEWFKILPHSGTCSIIMNRSRIKKLVNHVKLYYVLPCNSAQTSWSIPILFPLSLSSVPSLLILQPGDNLSTCTSSADTRGCIKPPLEQLPTHGQVSLATNINACRKLSLNAQYISGFKLLLT